MTAAIGYDFSGRTAVVTGGAGGFGKAIAERLLASGAKVDLWDVNQGGVERVTSEVALVAPQRVACRQVNVSDEGSVRAAAQAAVGQWGGIDILINNAGVLGPVASTWEHTTEQFRRVIDVNLTGAFICCRVVVPIMLNNPPSPLRGRIVNVASIQGKEGMAQAAAYAASKAGLIGLTKSLGKDLAETGILANVITPAAVMTAMADEITEQRKQDILNRIPMRRFLTSEEVAAQVAWLCSADCSFATGAVFDLSGGRATY
jgi:3-oxoacyl-[acyl-carrier protein] reductase